MPSFSQGRAGEPRLHADERGRYAPLYLAVAEAAQRVGATAIGLIDVGRAAGLNLNLDHVGIAYDHGALLGMSESPGQRAFMPVKHSTVPSTPLPEVVARLAVDRAPLDVTDEDVVGRLCASASSDSADELREELRLAASLPRASRRRPRGPAAGRRGARAGRRVAGRHDDVVAVAPEAGSQGPLLGATPRRGRHQPIGVGLGGGSRGRAARADAR